jgi:endo-1,4-beta-xylanase
MTPPTTSTKGSAVIDGETYTFYLSAMTGAGAPCSRTRPWMRIYSVRKTARQCGRISITEHIDAWSKAGIAIGDIDQITLAVEALDGVGTVDFTAASITIE